MKKLLVLTVIGFFALSSFGTLRAEDNRTEENWGFGTGMVIGALAGGPVGAIIGAASGAVIGDKLNDAQKVEPLNKQIAENKIHINSLQESLVEKDRVLDDARLLLSEQKAAQIKVSRNKELLSGIQIDLMFRTNSRELETGSNDKISPLVLMLEQFPQLELQLTGHGDVLGTDEANRQVAFERTQTVRQAFIDAGIDEQRIHHINQGRNQASAKIDDLDGRALDRRVRIRFIQVENNSTFALQ